MDFDPGAGTDTHTSNGECDAFLSCFSLDSTFSWVRTWGGVAPDAAFGLCIGPSGGPSNQNLFVVGGFADVVDFDPTSGTDTRTSLGSNECFLLKLLPNGLW